MIEPRFYRNRMGENRFHSFIVGYKDSDLWIGVDEAHFHSSLPEFSRNKLIGLRQMLEKYLLLHPEFGSSFTPVDPLPEAPDIAVSMAKASKITGTGPMAAVAGAFSEYIGMAIIEEYQVDEVVVENGGDIYLSLQKDLILSVYAGKSTLSGKIGLEIPASFSPLGICTSSGTVGPSVSFGKADAVMVACKNTALADAWATAIGNQVKTSADIEFQLNTLEHHPEILSLVVICDERIGIKGTFELKLINALLNSQQSTAQQC